MTTAASEPPSLLECISAAGAEAERCEIWAAAGGLSAEARATMLGRAQVWRRTQEALDLLFLHREDFVAAVRNARRNANGKK